MQTLNRRQLFGAAAALVGGGRQPKTEPANPIAYFEVAGPDSSRLADFYAGVFGWKPKPGPFPNYVSLASDGGAGLQGGFRQEDRPERVFYVKVADLQATLDSVVRAGGRVVIPPTNVPNVIHFALFEDPQGNRTGIIL